MADDINKQLEDIGKGGIKANQALRDLQDSIKILNQGFTGTTNLTQDLVNLLGKAATQSTALQDAVQKTKNGTAKLTELSNQKAAAESKAINLTSRAAALRAEAAKAMGKGNTSDALFFKSYAIQVEAAAQEAQQLANSFEQLRIINAELNKATKFFTAIGKFANKIPGLQGLGSVFEEMGNQLKIATVNGKDGFEKMIIAAKFLSKVAFAAFLNQAIKVDDEITSFQNNLNLSRKEAVELKNQFAGVALNAENIAINSVRIAKANAEINKQLGTAIIFSGELSTQFSILNEIVGLSAESGFNLAMAAQNSGMSLEDTKKNALGTSYALQRASGIALNNREVLEATGKVTGMIRANLEANPSLIAAAVTKAKLLGSELETISKAGRSFLDFEQSISAELEAELLTGRQINLEKARAAALAGDELTLANELSKNFGTRTEFLKMNVLQREKLAASLGLSADHMADMLEKQQFMGLNAKQLRAMGKNELADNLEKLSLQEKLNLAAEKFMTMMGDLVTIAMPLLDVFGSIVSYIAESKVLMSGLVAVMAALAAKSIATAIAGIFGASLAAGPLGIIMAIAGVAALFASLNKGKRAAGLAEGGIIPASPGGVPIIAGEAGRAEAIVPLNRLNQYQQPQQMQPIIVESKFSNFRTAAENQLNYTEMRQMNDGVYA